MFTPCDSAWDSSQVLHSQQKDGNNTRRRRKKGGWSSQKYDRSFSARQKRNSLFFLFFFSSWGVVSPRCEKNCKASRDCFAWTCIPLSACTSEPVLMEIRNLNTAQRESRPPLGLCQAALEECWTAFLDLHLQLLFFFPPPRLGQHLCSHSSSINPVCWGS